MTTNPAPKRKRSISWVEPGNLLAFERSRAKVRPSVQVLLAAVVGAALAALLVTFASLRHDVSWLSRDASFLLLLFPTGCAGIVAALWYRGRSIGLTDSAMAIVHVGAGSTRLIAFRSMARCTLETHGSGSGAYQTLTISREGHADLVVELPRGSLASEVIARLRDGGVMVTTDEA